MQFFFFLLLLLLKTCFDFGLLSEVTTKKQ